MFERVNDNVQVIRNVKQCTCCGGTVDRFCSYARDPHVIFATLYFECRDCKAIGDPFIGMMTNHHQKMSA